MPMSLKRHAAMPGGPAVLYESTSLAAGACRQAARLCQAPRGSGFLRRSESKMRNQRPHGVSEIKDDACVHTQQLLES